MTLIRFIFLAIVLLPIAASATTSRSHSLPAQFMRLHPCPGGPDKGHRTGTCRGYVRDHIVPLCKGGSDTLDNLQWQTVAEGKAKDRTECKITPQ